MSNILIAAPYFYFTDRDGNVLINGRIYIGEPNKAPENFPQDVFFDLAGSIPAPVPIRTNSAGFACDSAGNPQRLFTAGDYSMRVCDVNNAQVLYVPSAAEGFYGVVASDLANQTDPDLGTGMVGWIYDSTGVGSTLHAKLHRGWVDVMDFGAIGDGTANDKVAFDKAAATGRTILIPAGTYNVPSGDYSSVNFYSFDSAITNNPTIAIANPLNNSLSVGFEGFFSCSPANLPFGWLAKSGQTLNRTVYPDLWGFAQNSGNIVDEVDKAANPLAFGRGNGTTTFSLPNANGTVQGVADDGAAVDATLILGKRILKTSATGTDVDIYVGVSTAAIRAFGAVANAGMIDIQALQDEVTQNSADIVALDAKIDDVEASLQDQIDSTNSSRFGIGQSWTNPSRSTNVTYTNSTARPIMVSACFSAATSGGSLSAKVNGIVVAAFTAPSGGTELASTSFVVPPAQTYRIDEVGTVWSVTVWAELR